MPVSLEHMSSKVKERKRSRMSRATLLTGVETGFTFTWDLLATTEVMMELNAKAVTSRFAQIASRAAESCLADHI